MEAIFQLVNDSAELWQKLQQNGHASKLVFDHYLFAAELIEINLKKPLSLNFIIMAKSMLLFFVLDGDEGNIQHKNKTIGKTEQNACAFRVLSAGKYTFVLPAGKHKILQFIIRPEWMQHHSKSHPKLTSFLKKADQGADPIYHMPKCKINRDITRHLLQLERLHMRKVDDMEVETLKIFNKLMSLYLDMLPANEYMGYVSQQEQAAEIENYILENYKQPALVSIPAICNEFFIEERNLRRIFKAHTQLSIIQYILKLRMDMAYGLLKYDWKAKSVAFELGYQNEYYFNTAFKKYFGFSPGSVKRHNL